MSPNGKVEPLAQARLFLNPDEIFEPDTPGYAEESQTWAAQKNLNPHIVARPKSLQSLCNLIAYLGQTDLDFAVRSGGVGSSSARDVLISMTAFDSFELDTAGETITIGAGQTWHEVDRKLEKLAPHYAAISTRCSFIGVGGTITTALLSWMSSEFGIGIAPNNLLDAQIVLVNGRVLWASEEPDLLWALRGGGGSFGVVTKAKVKIFKYPKSIFAGRVICPREALDVVAREVARFSQRISDPKMCLHLYTLSIDLGIEEKVKKDKPTAGIVLLIYDANGEEHGRSEDGFAWVFRIPGAVEMTHNVTYAEMNREADNMGAAMGLANSYMSAPVIPKIDEELILRAWDWVESLLQAEASLATVPMGAFVLIELMHKPALYAKEPRTDCAWPHTSGQHVLQLGVASPIGNQKAEKVALQALEDAPKYICGHHKAGDFLPNFIQGFNDPKEVFGPNYQKLMQLKEVYDPRGKLKGPFTMPSENGMATT